MSRRILFEIMLVIILISISSLAIGIQQAEAEPTTWTVDDDGPADFLRIQDAVNVASEGDIIMVFSGVYHEEIGIGKSRLSILGQSRNNTIIWGSLGCGIRIDGNFRDIVVSGFSIENVTIGFYLYNADSCTIENNYINAAEYGIYIFYYAQGNRILNNIIIGKTQAGVSAHWCWYSGAEITGNTIVNSSRGIAIGTAAESQIVGNVISNNGWGIAIGTDSSSRIVGNNISFNDYAYNIKWGCRIYHNNFVNNTNRWWWGHFPCIWDDGYPSGGNYWSDYSGIDLLGGPYQNETSSDGIGDTPHVIDESNQDKYPLMNPWTDITVSNIVLLETKVYEGKRIIINVTVKNEGTVSESFNVTTFYDGNIIERKTDISLKPSETVILSFYWNTSGFLGNHRISAEASIVPGEIDTSDNILVDGILEVVSKVEIPIHGGENATIEGNVTINNIVVTKNTLHFDASGPSGSSGWINVTFPMINTTEIKVFINKEKLAPPPFPIITTNGTHYFIYLELTLSAKSIAVLFSLDPPIADFIWSPSIPKVNQSVTFDGTSSSANGATIVSYIWDFGDCGDSSGKIVTHAYAALGFYTVALNVSDSEGFWDIEQKQIQVVQPHSPRAEFTAMPDTASTSELIKFDALASLPGGNGTHEMPITEYRWDFDDGNQTTTSIPTIYHSFSNSGIYYVALTVYAPGATPETDSITHKVAVVSVPVGGYSFPVEGYTKATPLTTYLATIAVLTTVFTMIKCKTHRRTKRS